MLDKLEFDHGSALTHERERAHSVPRSTHGESGFNAGRSRKRVPIAFAAGRRTMGRHGLRRGKDPIANQAIAREGSRPNLPSLEERT